MFEEEAWAEAEAADRDLKFAKLYDPRSKAVKTAKRAIKARWTAMSDAERQQYADKIAAGGAAHAAYIASQCEAAARKASLLRALLRRTSGVHSLNLDSGSKYNSPAFSFAFDGGLLREVGAAWGTSLRIVRLGERGERQGTVTAEDVHVLLAACPFLALMDLANLKLSACKCCGAAPEDALFGASMAPHAELRAVALPPAAQHLRRFVERLLKRCPKLRVIDAETFNACPDEFRFDADGDDEYYGLYGNARREVLMKCAQLAASHGVTRFICSSFFMGGWSDGGSGYDSGGEYCGDGNVLKNLATLEAA